MMGLSLPVIIALAATMTLAILGGVLLDSAIERAEDRAWLKVWGTSEWPDLRAALRPVNDAWPPEGGAMQHFFGTDLVEYDPAADTEVFIERMASDTQEWLARLVT